MSKVVAEFTMSLDGFIAGPDDDVGPLFGWYSSGDTEFPLADSSRVFKVARASAELLQQTWSEYGAIVTGRRDFDVSDAWGGKALMGLPMFIVTHAPPREWTGPGSPFIFVTDGVAAALEQAKAAAGGKTVAVGGSRIVQQCLQAGLLDEVQIHLAPILLGAGIRLFDQLEPDPIVLERIGLVDGGGVTHLRFRVLR